MASYQGFIAVSNAFSDGTDQRRVDYRAVPRCVFTTPEVATVGVTERQARAQGMDIRIGFAEIAGLGCANTSEEFEGFVKVITDGDRKLIGAAIVAPRAGEMLHELSVAISLGATVEQIAATIHAFPTFSEAVASACGDALFS